MAYPDEDSRLSPVVAQAGRRRRRNDLSGQDDVGRPSATLCEVVDVLQRIDARIARIEATLAEAAKEVFTPREAARFLGVCEKTLAGLPVRSAKLGHRTRRYWKGDLVEFLKDRAG